MQSISTMHPAAQDPWWQTVKPQFKDTAADTSLDAYMDIAKQFVQPFLTKYSARSLS